MESLGGYLKNKLENEKVKLLLLAGSVAATYFVGRALYRKILKSTNLILYNEMRLYEKIEQARQASQAIVYLTIDQTITVEGEKYHMNFNLMRNIQKKEKVNELSSKDPFMPPFETGLHIVELGETHRLLFNKFSIYQNHVLVVTRQYEPQQQKLSIEDIKQTIFVKNALNGLFYFNCGVLSGASQPHRHTQIFPEQSKSLPFIPLIKNYFYDKYNQHPRMKILKYPGFEFVHGVVLIQETEDEAIATYKAYEMLYQSMIKKAGISYNLIGFDKVLYLVPRSKQKAFDELSINSVGFAGSLLFKNEKQFNFIKQLKPEDILQDVTFASQQQIDTFQQSLLHQ